MRINPSPAARGALLAALAILSPAAVLLSAQAGSPAGPVPPALLAARRAALLERIRPGVAILRSAAPRSIEAYGDHPQDGDYREHNDFFYLTGLEAPGGWLVLTAPDSGAGEAILFLPPRSPQAERWTGPRLGPGEEASGLTGIADVRSSARAEQEIRSLALGRRGSASRPDLYLVLGPRVEDDAFLRGLALGGGGATDLRPALAALRLVKDADEIARLRRAIAITAEGHRAAMTQAAPGMWEYEIEALVEYTFRRQGAERVGFPSIVGSGPNSTVLHYDRSRRRTEAGDLVVIDVGAEFGYYSADVTRTIPVSGRFTPRQRALYDLVLGAQQAAIDSIRPGMTIRRLGAIARDYFKANSKDLCGGDGCDRFFVHGLSHWLGMDVHDVGDYGTPLAPGMVLTVEPGLYLPDEAIGIRIEDDVLVTATGAEVLSADAPRRPEAIEALMRRRPGR